MGRHLSTVALEGKTGEISKMPLVLLLSLSLAAESKVKPPIRIAVYQLELQDVALAVGVVVSDSLLQEVRKLQGVNAIGMTEIRDMLSHEAAMQLAGCSESGESCMAELAGALGVDELLTGKLAKAGDASVITLRRLDHKRGEVTKVFDQRLKIGSGSEFLAVVGPAVEDLYKDFALRNGATRGVAKEVGLRLDPPPIPRVATIAIAAVSVATAIAAGILGVMTLTAQSEYTSYAESGLRTPIEGPTLTAKGNTLKGRALGANVLWGTAGGLAVVSGVMAFFTDWKNYRGENAKLTVGVQ
jgi:hypothetical protein